MLPLPPGFCRLVPHARSPGTWTIHFEGADYESHLLRENTELASPAAEVGGKDAGLALGEELWVPSLPTGNMVVTGRS